MHIIVSAEVRAVQLMFTSLCHIEVFRNKTQLDIVVEPFINFFECFLKPIRLVIRYIILCRYSQYARSV